MRYLSMAAYDTSVLAGVNVLPYFFPQPLIIRGGHGIKLGKQLLATLI